MKAQELIIQLQQSKPQQKAYVYNYMRTLVPEAGISGRDK